MNAKHQCSVYKNYEMHTALGHLVLFVNGKPIYYLKVNMTR